MGLDRRHGLAVPPGPVRKSTLRKPFRRQPKTLVIVDQKTHHLPITPGEYEDDAAEYLTEFPEYAPRINAVTALMASLSQPYTDYAALMVAIEAQMAVIDAQRRARRRARDIEALLLLDA